MLEDLEKSQIERHEGRTRLAVMIERMPAVLWTTDKEPALHLRGGRRPRVAGRRNPAGSPARLFPNTFKPTNPQFPSIAAHWSALAGESLTYELEWQKRVFESHVQPLRSSEGEILGVIGVALDITDRKQLADQLRQSQKMQAMGELAGGVAHDFNNLLMVVKGHAEMLPRSAARGASADRQKPVRHNVEQIQQAAERAAGADAPIAGFQPLCKCCSRACWI